MRHEIDWFRVFLVLVITPAILLILLGAFGIGPIAREPIPKCECTRMCK